MPILTDHVREYLEALRAERSPVMAEMEAVAERDHVPIVEWETGRLLAVLCRVLDPRVLEVGTAIGYSTLHMAEQLDQGHITTLEYDADRAAQARASWEQAGVADKIDLIEGDARETIDDVAGPVRPAVRRRHEGRLRAATWRRACRCSSDRALVVIDNLLMSGEVGLPEGADTFWSAENLTAARTLNTEILGEGWLGVVLPVGDGVGLAVRA